MKRYPLFMSKNNLYLTCPGYQSNIRISYNLCQNFNDLFLGKYDGETDGSMGWNVCSLCGSLQFYPGTIYSAPTSLPSISEQAASKYHQEWPCNPLPKGDKKSDHR